MKEEKAIEKDNVIVSAVLPQDVHILWDNVKWFLHRACKRSNGRHNINTIYDQLLANEMNLWVVVDISQDKYIGCGTTQIITYPTGMRMLEIVHLGGNNHEVWIDKGWQILERWAKENACHGLQAVGRKGLTHLTVKRDDKWKSKEVLFEKKFKEDE